MSGLQKAARTILAKLEAKPDLFFELLKIIKDEYQIVGPWEESATLHLRHALNDTEVARVRSRPDGTFIWLHGSVHGTSDTLEDAKHAADTAARGAGWVLA